MIEHMLVQARTRIDRYTLEQAAASAGARDVADRTKRVILGCAQGYSSSLAAASLAELGFERPGDLVGGFESWAEAGLPVAPAPVPADGLPGMGGPA
jgi:rhodanese-related sulfurtransferase